MCAEQASTYRHTARTPPSITRSCDPGPARSTPSLTTGTRRLPRSSDPGTVARVHGLREIVDAILGGNRTGIPWDCLPHDFPPCKSCGTTPAELTAGAHGRPRSWSTRRA
ncbi:transposase [Streptomyces clavifer]|uniref:transposase n=1 Tax=Streptomyces clavifer TaxID=68188 RepID=UPI0037A15E42